MSKFRVAADIRQSVDNYGYGSNFIRTSVWEDSHPPSNIELHEAASILALYSESPLPSELLVQKQRIFQLGWKTVTIATTQEAFGVSQ